MNRLPTFLLLAFITFLSTCVRAQNSDAPEKEISSTITTATVYLSGAQVSRTAKTTVPKGRNILVFGGLTKDMDPASIQINSANDAFTVLSVSHRLNFNELPDENPAADKIYDAMDALDRQKARLTVTFCITQEEEAILKLNRVVASPQTGLDAEDLIAAVNFHRERITFIKRRQAGIADSLTRIEEERRLLQEQLAETGLKRQTKATAEIVVVTQADRPVTDKFTLTYLVPNARWVPHYDVRVADISKPVDLRYRAKVYQQSGEDWTNVKLKLSTGDPSANGVAPTLPMWRLYQNSRPPVYNPTAKRQIQTGVSVVRGQIVDATGEALIGASVLVPGTTIGAVTDLDGYYDLEVPAGTRELIISYTGYRTKTVPANGARVVMNEDAAMLDEVVVTGYANKRRQKKDVSIRGSRASVRREETAAAPPPVTVQRRATTVSFDIELPYTIPSDGKARDVEIRRYDLPATYTHLAVPKFSQDAYLTAAVTDWEQYDLLSGSINLFFEGTFLGVSALDVSTVNDTLELSLGRDPNVIVERKATEDYRKRNFFGGKVTDSRGYTITARNKKNLPVNLVVMDQVPVSADENIEVKIDRDNRFKLEATTGILTWRTTLAAGATDKTSFGYTVKYPKGQRVVLE